VAEGPTSEGTSLQSKVTLNVVGAAIELNGSASIRASAGRSDLRERSNCEALILSDEGRTEDFAESAAARLALRVGTQILRSAQSDRAVTILTHPGGRVNLNSELLSEFGAFIQIP